MILTRYLYPKENVEYSFKIALFEGNHEQSLFWTYELYFSGFKQETLELFRDVEIDFIIPPYCENQILSP